MATPYFDEYGQFVDPGGLSVEQADQSFMDYVNPAAAPPAPAPNPDAYLLNAPNQNNATLAAEQAQPQAVNPYANSPVPDIAAEQMPQESLPGYGADTAPAQQAPVQTGVQELPPGVVAPLPSASPVTTGKYGVPNTPVPVDQTDYYEAERQRIAKEAEIQQQQQQAEQGYADQAYAAEVAAEDARKQAQSDHAIASARAQHAVRQAEEQVKDVNPFRVWSTAGTGGAIAGMINAFVSGFYAPQNGGHNMFLDQLNQTIDRDIQAQEMNQRKAQFMVGQAEKKLGQVDTSYQQQIADISTSRAARLEAASKMLQSQLAKFKSPMIALNGAKLQNELAKQKADELDAHGQRVYENSMKQAQLQQQIRSDQAARSLAERKFAYEKQQNEINRQMAAAAGPSLEDQIKVGKQTVVDAVTGQPLGTATNETTAKNANEAQLAWHSVERNLKRMEDLKKEIGTTVGNRFFRGAKNDALVAEFDALKDETATALAKLDDPGSTVRDAEKEATFKKRLPSYNTFFGEGPEAADAKIKAIRDSGRGKVKRAFGAAGLKFDPESYGYQTNTKDKTPAERALEVASRYIPEASSTSAPVGFGVAPAPKQSLFKGVAGKVGVTDLAFRADVLGDPEALKFLQAMAIDDNHPAQALAQEALARIQK